MYTKFWNHVSKIIAKNEICFEGIQLNPMKNSGTSNNKEMIYEDMRYARMVLNRVHEHCTRLNAEIFLH